MEALPLAALPPKENYIEGPGDVVRYTVNFASQAAKIIAVASVAFMPAQAGPVDTPKKHPSILPEQYSCQETCVA